MRKPAIFDDLHPSAASDRSISLVRGRWFLLLLAAVIGAAFYPASTRLDFNRSIAAMFDPADRTYQAYRDLADRFGGNAVVILVYEDSSLDTTEGIERNREISQQIESLPGVSGVLSPAKLNEAVEKFKPTGLLSAAGFGQAQSDVPALFNPQDRVAVGFDRLFAGYTHSRDHRRGAVAAMLKPSYPPQTIRELQAIANELPGRFVTPGQSNPIVSAALVGEPVLVHDGFDLIERDGARLAVATVTLLSIVVVIALADLRLVLLTVVTIFWSVIVTRGMMVLLQIELSLVSTILTAMITVIATTSVLHLGVRFRTAQWRGHCRWGAAAIAISLVMTPVFWTCATDAAGFAALGVSRILPIRQFGSMICIAALAVFLCLILVSPAVFSLPSFISPSFGIRIQRRANRWLHRRITWVAIACLGRPRTCVVVAMLLAGVSITGINKAETETSFLNNFRSDSPVVRDYREVEANFGGAGVWDIVLDAPETITASYLENIRRLEADLRRIEVKEARLNKVISLADADQIAAQSKVARLLSPPARLAAMRLVMPVFFDALLTPADEGARKLRIMLRSDEQLDSATKVGLIEAVEQTVDQHVASDAWREAFPGDRSGSRQSMVPGASVTGYYVIMSRLIEQLIRDQWRCFAASGLFVWLLLGLATRSIKLATVALLPNLLPIFMVLGGVGWFGGTINMGAAMIAAVSVGLSIDGSVHFFATYRRTRRRGRLPRDAARHAAAGIGVPVVLATVALIVGFGVLGSSEFVPTATFGSLVAATLLLGTLVNLTLLPALVYWSERTGSNTPRGGRV